MSLAVFNRWPPAEVVRDRLIKAGLDARVEKQSWRQRLWFVPGEQAGTCLKVPADQFEPGVQLLAHWDAMEGALREAIHCPECRSLQVQYPQFARHSSLTNITLGLAAGLGFLQKEFYCENCHFMWPREGERPRSRHPERGPYAFRNGVEQTTLSAPPEPKQGERREAA